MKTNLLTAIGLAVVSGFSLGAQTVEEPSTFANVYIGAGGGVVTPMHNHPFFGAMRGSAGVFIGKQLTPTFGVGIESAFSVNTSSWGGPRSANAFDNSYVGLYGTVDLFNLFGGYQCATRPFSIEALAGAGWGHDYYPKSVAQDYNYFATKFGLNFNFNVTDNVTIALKPAVTWNMNGEYEQSNVGYNINDATFSLFATVAYRFGDGFPCVKPYDAAQVNSLNARINELRNQVAAESANAEQWATRAQSLAADLDSCRARKPQIITKVENNLSSVRFVFFRVGSHAITADQRPNVEMIADYMKNHPKSNVVIKGYASPEGNYEFNVKLAQARADAVKNVLISKYKIAASRITAEGEGIGKMFEEESWNRVSICTLETE